MSVFYQPRRTDDARLASEGARELTVRVENFGLTKSVATKVSLKVRPNGREPVVFTAPLAALDPYASADLHFNVPAELTPAGSAPKAEVMIDGEPADNPLRVTLPTLP